MKKLLTFALVATSLSVAGVISTAGDAEAQTRTGTRMGSAPATIRDGNLTSDERARLATHEFAECLFSEKRERGLRGFLDAPVYSLKADEELEALLLDRCLSSGELTVTDDLLRGALYEVLYNKDGKIKKIKDFSATPELDHAAGVSAQSPRVASGIRFREYAECLVRSDTDASRDLIKSRLLSDAEDRAFRKIEVVATRCPTEGFRFTFSEPVVRGLIAEVLYKLASAESQRLESLES